MADGSKGWVIRTLHKKKCSVWDSNLRAQRMVGKLGVLTIEL